jgi:hypothetical protein
MRASATSLRVRAQASRLARMRDNVSDSPLSSRSKKPRSSLVSAREMPPVIDVRSISLSLLRGSSSARRTGEMPCSNKAAK